MPNLQMFVSQKSLGKYRTWENFENKTRFTEKFKRKTYAWLSCRFQKNIGSMENLGKIFR